MRHAPWCSAWIAEFLLVALLLGGVVAAFVGLGLMLGAHTMLGMWAAISGGGAIGAAFAVVYLTEGT